MLFSTIAMHEQLVKELSKVRQERNFNVESWVDAKCTMLNDYMTKYGLSACCFGMSGGIDSAVTCGI